MATVKAFPALRFTDKAGDISKNVCPPYDIISEEERLGFIAESSDNIIRLEKPVGTDAYAAAKKLYLEWRKDNIVDTDKTSGFYVYEEEFTALGETKKIRGIFARVKLCEFSEGVILPHEETLSKAKEDRFNLMCSTYCNFSPIYSMYTDADRKITSRVFAASSGKPDIEFTAKDGVVQRLWKIENKDDTEYIEKAFSDKQLFIADGHHRYETALRFKKKLAADGVIKDEEHSANYCMMMLIDMENDGLVVFPTHRIVKGLSDFDEKKAVSDIGEYFDVRKISEAEIEKTLSDGSDKKTFVMCANGGEFLALTMRDDGKASEKVKSMNPGKSGSYTELDVTVLHSLVLENILGIDKENMAKQINLAYTRDISEAVASVRDENVNCAFLINPTKVHEIKDVALAGEKMPQKSTYFYPKLITGLVMNELCEPSILE